MPSRTTSGAVMLATALFAAGCGGGSGSTVDATAPPEAVDVPETTEAVIPEDVAVESAPEVTGPVAPQAEGAVAPSDLPAVVVTDVTSGGQFNLGDLAPSDRPILLWFWAPH